MRVNLAQSAQIGYTLASLENDLPVSYDKNRCAGRTIRLELLKNLVNPFLRYRAFSHTNRQGSEQPGCSQQKSNLRALREYLASFALKVFYRKGRKGTPRSAQRKTLPCEVLIPGCISPLHAALQV